MVVNDLGCELDGTGGGTGPAGEVVAEIRAAGGEAIANGDDVADFDGAARMVAAALDGFGGLDVVVNNAGFVRDRMFANVAQDEWDAVIRVHLKGHFAVARHAAAHWRDQAKAGQPVDARIINTSSGAGILGSVGQAAYSAAKAGIATLTLVQAAELGRYGVTANALCPAARTRMTEGVFTEMMATPDEPDAFDAMAPENVSPLVAWLASAQSAHVTGRVFEVEGGKVGVATGWQHGPSVDKGARWDAAELGPVVDDLLARAPAPAPVYGTTRRRGGGRRSARPDRRGRPRRRGGRCSGRRARRRRGHGWPPRWLPRRRGARRRCPSSASLPGASSPTKGSSTRRISNGPDEAEGDRRLLAEAAAEAGGQIVGAVSETDAARAARRSRRPRR